MRFGASAFGRGIIMNKLLSALSFGACLMIGSVASAASLGLTTEGPVSGGFGSVFYFDGELTTDPDIEIDLGPAAGAFVEFIYANDPLFDAFNDGPDFVDIVASGFTDMTLEFQLSAGLGFANGSLFTMASGDFDFSGSDPLDFFEANANADGEFFTDVEVSWQGLASTTPIPLPASLPLVLAGLGSFAVLRRRRKAA